MKRAIITRQHSLNFEELDGQIKSKVVDVIQKNFNVFKKLNSVIHNICQTAYNFIIVFGISISFNEITKKVFVVKVIK